MERQSRYLPAHPRSPQSTRGQRSSAGLRSKLRLCLRPFPVLPLPLAIMKGIIPSVRHTVLRHHSLHSVMTRFISLLDQRQRHALFRRSKLVHLSDRFHNAATVEHPVPRIHLHVHKQFQQRRSGMDRWRYVPQERLHRLPREPGFRRLCCARFGCAAISHPSGRSDGDHRICGCYRHRLGKLPVERRVTQDAMPGRAFIIMRDGQHLTLLPSINESGSGQ
jgi:hypothetical protein